MLKVYKLLTTNLNKDKIVFGTGSVKYRYGVILMLMTGWHYCGNSISGNQLIWKTHDESGRAFCFVVNKQTHCIRIIVPLFAVILSTVLWITGKVQYQIPSKMKNTSLCYFGVSQRHSIMLFMIFYSLNLRLPWNLVPIHKHNMIFDI